MIVLHVYQPGAFLEISGLLWRNGQWHTTFAVLRTTVTAETSENPLKAPEFRQVLLVLPIDDKGNDVGSEPIPVIVDMYDIKEL